MTASTSGKINSFEVENKMGDKVAGERKILHNGALCDLYQSPNFIRMSQSRRMKWAGHEARIGEKRDTYRVLMGKPEGKKPLGRRRRIWDDNIKNDLQEVGWGHRLDLSGSG
jgi:hypothetical protein